MTSTAATRLHAIQIALRSPLLLILPDDAKLETYSSGNSTTIHIDGQPIATIQTLSRSLALVTAGLGTPHEHTSHHVPAFPLLEISSSSSIKLSDFWAVIYALFVLYHTQETIPIQLVMPSPCLLESYLLQSNLGRKNHALVPGSPTGPEIFLSRAAFWQGAGTAAFHSRGWLRTALQSQIPTPTVHSFTRNARVIASHPIRPPYPTPGEVLYQRYCPNIGETLTFQAIQVDGTPGGNISEHLAAFHKWHNDDLVNKAWGEKGSLEQHRKYLKDILADPGALAFMMSWNGELMGYVELMWIKEHPISQFIPEGARDYDRGPHVLVGEAKFRGSNRSHAWLGSVYHFCFLLDIRTDRVIGEPSATNLGILRASVGAGMYLHSVFDFPHKRSMLQFNLRDKFFKMDVL